MSERATHAVLTTNNSRSRTDASALTPSQQAELLDSLTVPASALGAIVVANDDLTDGDLPITVANDTIGGFRIVGLHGALDRLIDQIEREMGRSVDGLDREGKQAVVRRLDELGAFNLRKAVEDIADRIHVSRFTVYNYLNSLT